MIPMSSFHPLVEKSVRASVLIFSFDAVMMEKMEDAVMKMESVGGRKVDINFSPFEKIARLLYEGAFIAERYQGVRSFIEKGDVIPPGKVKDISNDERMLLITRSIIANTEKFNSADVFASMADLDVLKAEARKELDKIDVLLVPTAAYHYTIQEINGQEEKGIGSYNANLGRFTNFVNLLGMCGVSVPSSTMNIDLDSRQGLDTPGQEVMVPFGVTLLGKAWSDKFIGSVATEYSKTTGLGPGPDGHGIPAH